MTEEDGLMFLLEMEEVPARVGASESLPSADAVSQSPTKGAAGPACPVPTSASSAEATGARLAASTPDENGAVFTHLGNPDLGNGRAGGAPPVPGGPAGRVSGFGAEPRLNLPDHRWCECQSCGEPMFLNARRLQYFSGLAHGACPFCPGVIREAK